MDFIKYLFKSKSKYRLVKTRKYDSIGDYVIEERHMFSWWFFSSSRTQEEAQKKLERLRQGTQILDEG